LWRGLPASRHFHAHPLVPAHLFALVLDHLRDPALRWLFAEGFLLMGSFVTVYNYLSYRLVAPPYRLNQTEVGAIFTVYLVGVLSSAWIGDLAGRLGRRNLFWATVLVMLAGLAITLAGPLAAIVGGIAVFTFGFFGAHSIASSWIGLRARHAKAQASSLYLLFYYLGSSIAGSVGGFFWNDFGWPGIAAFTGILLLIALAISLRLISVPPITAPAPMQ
jgi:YNFM family putative membrane transporter